MAGTRTIKLEKQPDGRNMAVVTTEDENRTEVKKQEVSDEQCHRIMAELLSKRRSHMDEVAALDAEIAIWRSIEEQLRAQ